MRATGKSLAVNVLGEFHVITTTPDVTLNTEYLRVMRGEAWFWNFTLCKEHGEVGTLAEALGVYSASHRAELGDGRVCYQC